MQAMSVETRRRASVICAIAIAFAVVVARSATAAVAMTGQFTTPSAQATISYTPLRAFRGGSEGRFVVAGKSYPGSMYAARGGGVGLVWYYGTSGIMAGNALVTLQPDGTWAGPIWFFDRQGNTTDSGTVVVTFP